MHAGCNSSPNDHSLYRSHALSNVRSRRARTKAGRGPPNVLVLDTSSLATQLLLLPLSLCTRLCRRPLCLCLLLKRRHLLEYRCILQQLRQGNEPHRATPEVDAGQFRHLSIPCGPDHIRQRHIHGIFRRYEKAAIYFPILHLYRDLHPLGLEEELDWYPRGAWRAIVDGQKKKAKTKSQLSWTPPQNKCGIKSIIIKHLSRMERSHEPTAVHCNMSHELTFHKSAPQNRRKMLPRSLEHTSE